MTEHTPWRVESKREPTAWSMGDVTYENEYFVRDSRGSLVAQCGSGDKGKTRACFMATAPDLLVACEALIRDIAALQIGFHFYEPASVQIGRHAIAKAKGE